MDLHSEVYVEPNAPVVRRPPRSRLFALEPIGVGTADCEGLVSYLVRLAREHSVDARVLFREVVFRQCGHLGGLRYPIFFNGDARSVNGIGTYAKVFSQAGIELTSREDLPLLTMLPWHGIFPEKGAGLISRHPRWCKLCLREHYSRAKKSYFPLAWSLELHAVCGRHGIRLSDSCPCCGRKQPIIPFVPHLDQCAYCSGWLAAENQTDQFVAAKTWELWMADAIDDMIAHNPDAGARVTGEAFRSLLPALVDQHADGEKKRFSKLLGMTETTMSCWITKGQKPTFPQFLKLCHGLGIMPSELFGIPDSKSGTSATTRLPLKLHPIKPKIGRRGPNKSRISSALDVIVADTEDHRPLIEVAEHLEVTAQYLRYWFAEHSRRITSKRKKHLSSIARETCEFRKKEVRNATLRIFCHGDYPSKGKVAAAIKPLKIYLQSPELRAAYKNALKDIQG
jgi:hypothetical protein